MVPAFMLSLLQRQQLMLQARFKERYPSCWLVWEPGSWKPPHSADESDSAKTQLPGQSTELRPRGTDALCFQLYVGRGANEAQLTLGRSSEGDIVINDMTVSREHLRLSYDGGSWSAEATWEPAGQKQKLASGGTLKIGGVTLTYYDADGFLRRLTG